MASEFNPAELSYRELLEIFFRCWPLNSTARATMLVRNIAAKFSIDDEQKPPKPSSTKSGKKKYGGSVTQVSHQQLLRCRRLPPGLTQNPQNQYCAMVVAQNWRNSNLMSKLKRGEKFEMVRKRSPAASFGVALICRSRRQISTLTLRSCRMISLP